MRPKKNPKFDIDRNSAFYFAVGFAAIMLITHIGMNHKSKPKVAKEKTVLQIEKEEENEIPITEFKQAPPPPPPPAAAPEIIEIVEDEEEIEETLIESSETDELEKIEEPEVKIEEVVVEEVEEDIEVPFTIIEQVPIFPGCEVKRNNADRRKCMSDNITKHVNKKFNSYLASELGLSGKMRIFVMFKINKQGDVVNVKARAPHPALAKEAERVVKSLPKMKPGKQRNKPVTVPYSLPIIFVVKER